MVTHERGVRAHMEFIEDKTPPNCNDCVHLVYMTDNSVECAEVLIGRCSPSTRKCYITGKGEIYNG